MGAGPRSGHFAFFCWVAAAAVCCLYSSHLLLTLAHAHALSLGAPCCPRSSSFAVGLSSLLGQCPHPHTPVPLALSDFASSLFHTLTNLASRRPHSLAPSMFSFPPTRTHSHSHPPSLPLSLTPPPPLLRLLQLLQLPLHRGPLHAHRRQRLLHLPELDSNVAGRHLLLQRHGLCGWIVFLRGEGEKEGA